MYRVVVEPLVSVVIKRSLIGNSFENLHVLYIISLV